MTLSKTLKKNSLPSIAFEILAASGLALNAIVVSGKTPLEGELIHAVSVFMFGLGVIGLGLIYSVQYADSNKQNILRPVTAVYGGMGLAIVSSLILALLAAYTPFNNLLAILILGGFSYMYVGFWRSFETYKEEDLWFHS